jgi:hypothetical protein
MKAIIITTAVALCTGLSAQKLKEAQVPAAVKEAFAKQFPNVKDTDWEKEGQNYEAEFEVKRVNMESGKSVKPNVEKSAVFDASGQLLQVEEEIPVSQLPAGVRDYVTKTLSGKKIAEAAKITDTKGTVTYEAEVAKEDYIFDSNGNFLSKEKEGKDDNDKK